MSGAPEQSPLKPPQDYAEVRDWPGYFRAVLGKPPRETLMKALELFEAEGRAPEAAIDLACGEGRDTLELLRRGWHVEAIEEHPDGFELLLPRVPAEHRSRLTTRAASFRGLTLPSVDLLNVSFALPFCEPADFPALWDTIVKSIKPGGRFAGQFFGNRDSWATMPDRTHHTREQVEELFEGFEFEMLNEEERDSAAVTTGEPKHWHVFHIVARKRPC